MGSTDVTKCLTSIRPNHSIKRLISNSVNRPTTTSSWAAILFELVHNNIFTLHVLANNHKLNHLSKPKWNQCAIQASRIWHKTERKMHINILGWFTLCRCPLIANIKQKLHILSHCISPVAHNKTQKQEKWDQVGHRTARSNVCWPFPHGNWWWEKNVWWWAMWEELSADKSANHLSLDICSCHGTTQMTKEEIFICLQNFPHDQKVESVCFLW